ncbi:hypothetical protein PR202_gb22274 [Eleusine coracana subsp. coracana]|uniref:Ubiquitin-like domain-containing protein n=1 Tax=Eleusine coracana subsp. coracana TaxID=191504 RepID=A0AAV5FG44_ELECO|nr:hypothetical protein QOZ80_6AG0539190 [Eleusine coracana subsp. coracana]GJN33653.1 hypothetical protein PR202_gb22274 [Eleusine coracana subsp. coracana]
MDVSFVCSGEEPLLMEVGFFDTVEEIKQKLQSRRGWPAAAMSLLHNGDVLDGGGGIERYGIVEGSVIHVTLRDRQQQQQQEAKGRKASKRGRHELRVTVVSRCGAGRVEVAVCARAAVSALRAELEVEAGFPLPRDGGYFFIHRQSVMDEARSFEWHGVATGDEVVVFDGSVTRGPAYC